MNAEPTRAQTEDVKREIQATLEARRELGPAYDEQFLDTLVERITRQVTKTRQSSQPVDNHFTAKQRSELAICSLIFGIPLIAIAGGEASLPGIIAVCAAIVTLNLGAKWM